VLALANKKIEQRSSFNNIRLQKKPSASNQHPQHSQLVAPREIRGSRGRDLDQVSGRHAPTLPPYSLPNRIQNDIYYLVEWVRLQPLVVLIGALGIGVIDEVVGRAVGVVGANVCIWSKKETNF
jgi:hypothetical protein